MYGEKERIYSINNFKQRPFIQIVPKFCTSESNAWYEIKHKTCLKNKKTLYAVRKGPFVITLSYPHPLGEGSGFMLILHTPLSNSTIVGEEGWGGRKLEYEIK